MSVSPYYYNQPYRTGFYPAGNPFYAYRQPPMQRPPYGQPQGQDPQRQHNAFYAGYDTYISPYQHPMMAQEMVTAANNWFLESAGRFPWAQVIPTWTDASRMWLRGNHERWLSRNPIPREPLYWVSGAFVKDFSRLG